MKTGFFKKVSGIFSALVNFIMRLKLDRKPMKKSTTLKTNDLTEGDPPDTPVGGGN